MRRGLHVSDHVPACVELRIQQCIFATSTKLGMGCTPIATVRLRLVPKAKATPVTSAAELVVEVGSARVRVAAGFDSALPADVVRVLAGDR